MGNEKIDFDHVDRKYRDRMLQMAFVASGWSPCPEGQRHGCVLALYGKYPVAVGYNGHDRNLPGLALGGKVVHAEINAILNAKMVSVDFSNCVAFTTKKPCPACFAALYTYGVVAITWLQDVGGDECRWIKDRWTT